MKNDFWIFLISWSGMLALIAWVSEEKLGTTYSRILIGAWIAVGIIRLTSILWSNKETNGISKKER